MQTLGRKKYVHSKLIKMKIFKWWSGSIIKRLTIDYDSKRNFSPHLESTTNSIVVDNRFFYSGNPTSNEFPCKQFNFRIRFNLQMWFNNLALGWGGVSTLFYEVAAFIEKFSLKVKFQIILSWILFKGIGKPIILSTIYLGKYTVQFRNIPRFIAFDKIR